jgi:acetyl esterase/lipase
MNWVLTLSLLTLILGGPDFALAAESKEVLDVWPGKPPSESGDIGEEIVKEPPATSKYSSRNITNVTHPTLSVFRPKGDKNTGVAIVIAPGGGYNVLAFDKEGTDVAEWAAAHGMTGIVLKYRVPRRPDTPAGTPPVQPLQDAQRAMSVVRNNASQWGVDPKKIGFLGFSAGGHLTANLATHFEKRAYDRIDTVDDVSCRPDFAMAIYPGGLIDKETGKLNADLVVTDKTPPMFFAHATDDKLSSENSIQMYLAEKKAGLPTELHVYATGGHGFGMRPTSQPGAAWPSACEKWLQAINVLPGKEVRQ